MTPLVKDTRPDNFVDRRQTVQSALRNLQGAGLFSWIASGLKDLHASELDSDGVDHIQTLMIDVYLLLRSADRSDRHMMKQTIKDLRPHWLISLAGYRRFIKELGKQKYPKLYLEGVGPDMCLEILQIGFQQLSTECYDQFPSVYSNDLIPNILDIWEELIVPGRTLPKKPSDLFLNDLNEHGVDEAMRGIIVVAYPYLREMEPIRQFYLKHEMSKFYHFEE